ncbi:MAG: hypothetical protein KBG54_00190 [Oscillospiraceae bacterium]|nr:hypothetical protein [Oscillospiraceae bacterium]
MKTVFLTTSPKKHKRWANSTYFLWLTKLFFAKSDAICLDLGGKKDYDRILQACKDADAVVFAMPVYVDAIPSHVLAFLEVAEEAAKRCNWHCKVYTITNCGFFEGVQCEALLTQMEYWCRRANLAYSGGLGIGAGEMLGIIRFTNVALAALMLVVQCVIGACAAIAAQQPLLSSVFHSVSWLSIGITLGVYMLFSLGLFIHTICFAQAIRQHKTIKNRYTTVWFCGRWLFMLFASLFWTIRAAGHFVPLWGMLHKVPKDTQ